MAPQSANKEGAANDEDPFCEFWRGEDPRLHAELCGLLAEALIPYRTAELQDHLFNRLRFPEFRIAIPFSAFEGAEELVAEAYGSGEAADSVMHPTEENRPEFQKLINLPLEEKLQGKPEEEHSDLTWKGKRETDPEDEKG